MSDDAGFYERAGAAVALANKRAEKTRKDFEKYSHHPATPATVPCRMHVACSAVRLCVRMMQRTCSILITHPCTRTLCRSQLAVHVPLGRGIRLAELLVIVTLRVHVRRTDLLRRGEHAGSCRASQLEYQCVGTRTRIARIPARIRTVHLQRLCDGRSTGQWMRKTQPSCGDSNKLNCG
jgi:hypothetical protein